MLHSFWVPNLAGKLDMIPGRTNRLTFTPDTAGRVPWPMRRVLRRPARADGAVRRHAVGLRRSSSGGAQQRQAGCGRPIARSNRTARSATRCAGSHARGTLGPDLTHVGSRLSIGAGTLPTDAAQLARWITSSQHVKPGNLMPAFREFTGEELAALAGYLASLR